MSVGSLSSSTVSTATLASADTAAQAAKAREAGQSDRAETPTIADHVAADSEREPIRSASTTLGTLVDTYL